MSRPFPKITQEMLEMLCKHVAEMKRRVVEERAQFTDEQWAARCEEERAVSELQDHLAEGGRLQ